MCKVRVGPCTFTYPGRLAPRWIFACCKAERLGREDENASIATSFAGSTRRQRSQTPRIAANFNDGQVATAKQTTMTVCRFFQQGNCRNGGTPAPLPLRRRRREHLQLWTSTSPPPTRTLPRPTSLTGAAHNR